VEASRQRAQGTGWAAFAATMILVLGTFNLLWGISALAGDDHFVADELLFGDLTLWGIIYVFIGAAQVFTSMAIFAGSDFAAVVGIMFAGFNALGALMSIGAYPIWSVIIIVVDGLVIYALTVYGDALGSG
jgi:hypothetical protein